jgi:hypothetical protein
MKIFFKGKFIFILNTFEKCLANTIYILIQIDETQHSKVGITIQLSFDISILFDKFLRLFRFLFVESCETR